ncbi:MAG: hypothetical protein CMD79_00170, partial [Gammaproteobacteria bacterium]|nr:hypothetical protein [Gammaproteobacteria bacterium]
MNTFKKSYVVFWSLLITACGGGGGGSMGSDDSYGGGSMNNAPVISNTLLNISVRENQTSAFTVTATDSDNDSLTYSLAGTDASLLSISSSGVVTFVTAPDFENPADADTNNVYQITASVSDGSASASKDFSITVTNDTSDDITTAGYDGIYIGPGPIQGATVCVEVTRHTCTGAEYTTTTAQDGTFSLTVNTGTNDIVIRGEGGFDPVTNLQFDDVYTFALGQPVTDQNFV